MWTIEYCQYNKKYILRCPNKHLRKEDGLCWNCVQDNYRNLAETWIYPPKHIKLQYALLCGE